MSLALEIFFLIIFIICVCILCLVCDQWDRILTRCFGPDNYVDYYYQQQDVNNNYNDDHQETETITV